LVHGFFPTGIFRGVSLFVIYLARRNYIEIEESSEAAILNKAKKTGDDLLPI
jgi:hypothetical protein